MSEHADRLRTAMVDALVDSGAVTTPAVADAMRAVPRHLFVPDVALDTAYADVAIPTKTLDGRAISSASQPAIVGIMLEQLALRPGDRVLEIGAGTGYNAALLARLAGPAGRVRTVDIDDDIVRGARAHLVAAGAGDVEVVLGDGVLGDADHAPYDRMIATVGIWDIPPSWWEQLAPGGRLVAPLSVRGLQLSVALDKIADREMQSASVRPCGFMRLRGRLGYSEKVVTVGGLTVTTEDDVDPAAVSAALAGDCRVEAIGVSAAAADAFGSIAPWLAVHADGYCTVNGGWRHREPPLRFAAVMPSTKRAAGWSPAVFDGRSLAVVGRDRDALVVTIYGDSALMERVATVLRGWHESGRPSPADLRLRVRRLPAPDPVDTGVVITKRWTTISAQWSES